MSPQKKFHCPFFFLSTVTFNKVPTYTPYTLNSIHGTCATSLGLVTILIFWNCTILVNADAEGLCCHPVDDAKFDEGFLVWQENHNYVNSIQFKALFRVDINHTYNTSSNELLKSTMLTSFSVVIKKKVPQRMVL